jgi:hypothetical protein
VKLSAKWLTALAALALLVVAVAGLTMSSKPASAATGTINVANEWSKLTTESPAPSGYIYVGAGKSVYATYPVATRLTESGPDTDTDGAGSDVDQDGSNLLKVVVVDTDLNQTEIRWDDADTVFTTLAGAGFTFLAATPVGGSQTFFLSQVADPISGTLSDIVLVDRGPARTAGTDAVFGTSDDVFTPVSSSVLQVVNKFDGDGTQPAWITVQRNSGSTLVALDIRYPTSSINTTNLLGAGGSLAVGSVKVKTDANPDGVGVRLLETSRSSGRFEGFINILENVAGNDASSTAAGDYVAKIRTNAGPVTIEYNDGGTTRSVQVAIDTTAPTITITAPTNGSATQNRLPTFAGSVTDAGAGLKLAQQVSGTTNVGPAGTFNLFIDRTDDPLNTAPVLATGGVPGSGSVESVSLGSVTDSQTSLNFSQTPLTALPSTAVTVPDHKVDFQVRVSDLAGNQGFSDSDTSSTTAGSPVTGGFQAHTVQIDQKIPALLSNANFSGCSSNTPPSVPGNVCPASTGKVYDTVAKADSVASTSRNNVRVTFDGSVTGVDASDFSVTFSSGGTHVPSSVTVNGAVVYLTLAAEIPSSDKPTVALAGTVSDLAGNGTATGSVATADGLPPKITVTLSGGSGTGTGSESAAQLTKSTIIVDISVDEALSVAPTVETFILNGAAENGPSSSLSQGGNLFRYTVPSLPTDGDKAVKVVATDSSSNAATSGGASTKSYKKDSSLAAPTVTPANGSTTSLRRPFITVDYGVAGEASSVTISEITLDGSNVVAQLVASSDKKKFFIVPTTDLTLAEHTVAIPVGKAKDAAGNENAAVTTFKFTVAARKPFNLGIFAGWQAVSVPSNPVDPAIAAVFTNTGIDQVVAYNAANPANPWSIATRDATSGNWTSTTETPLTSIMSGRGYWVHANNFETQSIPLVGPVEPGAGSPPPISTIPVAAGWNFIGVVDTSRQQTEVHFGAGLLRGSTAVLRSDYFSGVTASRVYRYNPTLLRFEEVLAGAQVTVGDGLWVNIAAAGNVTP